MKLLTVYTKKPCVQCDAVTRWLDKRPHVEHKLVELTEDLAVKFKNMGLMRAPILEAADGSLSCGFDTSFLGRFDA
jgi:glutaredoxin-like protein NrdH